MLKRGKTVDMEEREMKAKLQNFVSDGNLTIEEKVSLMKTQLNTEAKCLMEELLKQGYCKEEVSITPTPPLPPADCPHAGAGALPALRQRPEPSTPRRHVQEDSPLLRRAAGLLLVRGEERVERHRRGRGGVQRKPFVMWSYGRMQYLRRSG